MKVIFAGFPKTGTKSMNVALTMLGYTCIDFDDNFYVNGDKWLEVMAQKGKVETFREMFKDYDATMDTPTFMYWEEILEAFPDAKIITCVREEKSWIKSMMKQSKSIEDNLFIKQTFLFSATSRKFVKYCRAITWVVFGGYQSILPWRIATGFREDILLKKYRHHNAYLEKTVPPDKLLVLKMGDGWEPLCRFLGKPIPKEPYPHANQGAELMKKYEKMSPAFLQMKKEAQLSGAIMVCILSVIVFFVFYY